MVIIVIASPTAGHVLVGAANHFDSFVFAGKSLRESRILPTGHAHCLELVHGFGEGDQLENAIEVLPLECSVQSGNQDDLALIRHTIGELDNIAEELTLVNAHH